jgi:hypothetical protein
MSYIDVIHLTTGFSIGVLLGFYIGLYVAVKGYLWK